MSTPSKKAGSPKPIMATRNWTARRAHAGEDYTSNKDAAREAFLKRRPELAVAEQLREVERAAMKAKRSGSKKQKTKFSGTELDEAIARLTLLAETQTVESLREKMVTQPLERAGFQIRDDKKSTAKHADGRANVIMTSGGIEYNVSDMRRPTASLPADKAKRILDDLNEFLGQDSKQYDFASFRSLTFRLQDAMKVVPRGKIHTNGMYRALRGKDEGDLVAGSNWVLRNMKWWQRYFSSGCQAVKLLSKIIECEFKDCLFTDASTSTGFGGYYVATPRGESVPHCYYIEGTWTPREHELIDAHPEFAIGFLEMATVNMLLAAATVDINDRAFVFYCDNQTTVAICDSLKTRVSHLATLLESIDIQLETRHITTEFIYIRSEDNIGSDLLSRGEREKFFARMRKIHGMSIVFSKLEIPTEARDIEDCVDRAIRTPDEWIHEDEIKECMECEPARRTAGAGPRDE
jgi:hypothetical protein